MMTVAGLIFKWFTAKLMTLKTFVFKHWRIFLPLAIVCLGLWKINSLANERDTAIKVHADYLVQVQDAKRQRAIENLVIEQRTQLVLGQVADRHREILNQIWSRHNEHNIRQGNAAARTIDDLRGQLRNTLKTFTADGLPGLSQTAEGSTESGAECHAAIARRDEYIETLKAACRYTTNDFNYCAESWAAACEEHGCR